MPIKINLALPVYGAAYKSVFVRSLFAALTHKSCSARLSRCRKSSRRISRFPGTLC